MRLSLFLFSLGTQTHTHTPSLYHTGFPDVNVYEVAFGVTSVEMLRHPLNIAADRCVTDTEFTFCVSAVTNFLVFTQNNNEVTSCVTN